MPSPSVCGASRRTTALNAYVSGFGSTRRIVVYDTLLDELPDAEIESIAAHELGHVVADDVLTGTLVGALGAGAGVALRRRGLTAAVGGADDLVPAQVLGGVAVGAAGPGGGEGRGGELGGHGTIPRHRRAGAQRGPDDARHGASSA